jgi:aspartyl/asparaginyl-tRNA synthetase
MLKIQDIVSPQTSVKIYGRLQCLRKKRTTVFLIVNDNTSTMQTIVTKENVDPERISELIKIPKESVICLIGDIVATQYEIKSVTCKNFEMIVKDFILINESEALPFDIFDANDFKNNKVLQIHQSITQYSRYNLLVKNSLEIFYILMILWKYILQN